MARRMLHQARTALVTSVALVAALATPSQAAPSVVAVPDASEAAAQAGRAITVARDVAGRLVFEDYEATTAAGAERFADSVVAQRGVVAAEVKTPVHALYTDPLAGGQWDLDRMSVPLAQTQSTGSGQVIAVVDTGVDASHPDLSGQILPGKDFVNGAYDGRLDGNGHGTHVAGTIAALTNNGTGIAGIAPGARILPVRVLNNVGSGYDSDIADGIVWATDHGATVINLSLGGDTASSLEESAVNYAVSRGVVVVAAAGNSGHDGNPVFWPAAFPNVIAVAAADENDGHPVWSEYGSQIDLTAPGTDIVSTIPGNRYAAKDGTSMASPHVAAVAALVRSRRPSLSVAQVRSTLEQSAQDLGSPGRDDFFGFGMVNASAALNLATNLVGSALPSLPTARTGAWSTAGDGGVFSFGGANFYGSTGSIRLNQPIVGISTTGSGAGYRFVASDGGIFTYGDAGFFGSTGSLRLNQPIVGMATTASGQGYWLVASDGGIFTFGDARFFGSTGALRLNSPIVGMSATPSGNGYWLVAADGGIFTFGDAPFFGSTGGVKLSAPVVGIASTGSGRGYLVTTNRGQVFTFGDANWRGEVSTGGVVGVAATPSGNGYVIAGSDGSLSPFGDATALVAPQERMRLNRPVVGITLVAH